LTTNRVVTNWNPPSENNPIHLSTLVGPEFGFAPVNFRFAPHADTIAAVAESRLPFFVLTVVNYNE